MNPILHRYVDHALREADRIPTERAAVLAALAGFIADKRERGEVAALTFICTHNSRRSQMAQVWASTAAAHFRIGQVQTYSGGTEVTAFHPHAVAAIRRAGFVVQAPAGDNPPYRVAYDSDAPSIECYSKRFDDPPNPATGFAAVMTCSDADAACPFVPGADVRVRLTYEDPKISDGSPAQDAVYDRRCLQIAAEMLQLFSMLV